MSEQRVKMLEQHAELEVAKAGRHDRISRTYGFAFIASALPVALGWMGVMHYWDDMNAEAAAAAATAMGVSTVIIPGLLFSHFIMHSEDKTRADERHASLLKEREDEIKRDW